MMQAEQLLTWYEQAGVDEAIGDEPINHLATPEILRHETPAPRPAIDSVQASTSPVPRATQPIGAMPMIPAEAIKQAQTAADAATSLDELRAEVAAFDGCALKKTAGQMVFADGNSEASVMVIGEAPGAEEDKQGIPFCGPSGQLLDKVLGSIGLDRAQGFYITNTVFWRPPGNRQPSKEELAICKPLLEKHIALVKPKLLILAGSVAASAVLGATLSMGKLRGKPHDYHSPALDASIPTFVVYHPSYLLRSPGQKKQAWIDMLKIQAFLQEQTA